MVTSEIRAFSKPFDYLLISWMTNNPLNRKFLECLSDRLAIKNSTRTENFQNVSTKYMIESFVMLFRVFRFSKASFNALTCSFTT